MKYWVVHQKLLFWLNQIIEENISNLKYLTKKYNDFHRMQEYFNSSAVHTSSSNVFWTVKLPSRGGETYIMVLA